MGTFTNSLSQYPIVIGNNGRVDTTNHEPDPQFETVLKILEVGYIVYLDYLLLTLLQIDEDLARKQLIINQAIEQTILINSREDATNIMNETRLSNVKQCYAFNARGSGHRLSYGWGGGLVSAYVPAWSGPPRMKTDVEYQVK